MCHGCFYFIYLLPSYSGFQAAVDTPEIIIIIIIIIIIP